MRVKVKLCMPVSDDEFSLTFRVVMNPLVKLSSKIDGVGKDL